MSAKLLFVLCVGLFLAGAPPLLRADQVDMQNGDRYFGKVLNVTSDSVIFESEMLGRVRVPVKKVSSIAFGTNTLASKPSATIAPVAAPQSVPTAAPSAALTNNADLPAALRSLGANTNFIGQIRDQMLAGSPEAAGKYDELVGGLMTGKLNMDDIRREAKSAADQLRELKRDEGSDASDSLDTYLTILDNFLKETAPGATNATPAIQTKPKSN